MQGLIPSCPADAMCAWTGQESQHPHRHTVWCGAWCLGCSTASTDEQQRKVLSDKGVKTLVQHSLQGRLELSC